MARIRSGRDGLGGWVVAGLAGVAGAVAAGTLPDVIKDWWGDRRAFLSVLCVAAAVVFAGLGRWQQRRRGVGIVVTLRPEYWREPWSRQWPVAAADNARRHHDSCFVIEREIAALRPGDPAEENERRRRSRAETLDFAYELVNARLMEAAVSDPAGAVSLFVNAPLPEAYELGAKLKFNVHREVRALSTLVLQQRSEVRGRDFHPALRIDGGLKEPLRAGERSRAATLARIDGSPDFAADPSGNAVALVVHLADNPAMVAEALMAAGAGCVDTGGRRSWCRGALVVDGGPANIPERTADFELVVRHVYAEWRAWLRVRPEYAELDKVLFIAAPVSIGFALGWLFRHTVGVVAYQYERSA